MYFKTKTTPKKWTIKEEQTAYNLYKKGYNFKTIGHILKRSEASIQNKIRRLNKQKGINHYDKGHSLEKHLINQRFIKQIQPTTVLDLYNGGSNQYREYNTITNDINQEFNTDYHKDSQELLQYFYDNNKTFEFIDLDPFGAVAPLIPYAIQLAKKGIAITFGEFGHKRLKRTDYVEKHYNIQKYEDFTLKNINKYVVTLAKKHDKTIKPIYIKDWNYICRIWYKIEQR